MVKNIVIDCDGVLTDGKKYVDETGEREMIAFHSRDNEAIKSLQGAGYRVIIVTASPFPGIRRYWGRYNVEVFWTREKHRLSEIAAIDWDETLGVGDDFLDASFLGLCRYAYVVADAHQEMRRLFATLKTPGGRGVMAEVWRLVTSDIAETETITTT